MTKREDEVRRVLRRFTQSPNQSAYDELARARTNLDQAQYKNLVDRLAEYAMAELFLTFRKDAD